MLFPPDVGTSFCFVNTCSTQTMLSVSKLEVRIAYMCEHRHNDLCETYFTSLDLLSLCVRYLCLLWWHLQVYFTANLNTPPHTQTHARTHTETQLLTRENDWVPPLETVKRKGKWLTSHVSLSFLISGCHCAFFKLLCLTVGSFMRVYIHALPPLSLSTTFSTTFSVSGSLPLILPCPALSFHPMSLTSSLFFF